MGFFDKNIDNLTPGTKITFGILDIVANKLGNLHLCDPNDPIPVTNAKIFYIWTINIISER